MTISELIDALEKAERPSRELDAEIFELIFSGRYWPENGKFYRKDGLGSAHPAMFTSSIDTAVALCERVLPGMTWRVERTSKAFDAYVWDDPEYDAVGISDNTATPAIALCIATLKAKEKTG